MDAKDCQSDLIGLVLGSATAVHRALGPGLLESVYERALCIELAERGVEVARQVAVPVSYRGRELGLGFRMDLVVARHLVVEIKSVQRLEDVHVKQVLSYLRLAGLTTGLLLNFNRPLMKQGIRKVSLFVDPPCAP